MPDGFLTTRVTKTTKLRDLRALRSCHSAGALYPQRFGFTLVELLVVLIIIAILGTVIMFAMFSAQEAARAAKTKNVISKLNMLVMQRYESYINRRVPNVPSPFPRKIWRSLSVIARSSLPSWLKSAASMRCDPKDWLLR